MKRKMKILIMGIIVIFTLSLAAYGENDEENVDDQLSVDVTTESAVDTGTNKDEFLRAAKDAEAKNEVSKAIENYKKYLKSDGYRDPNAIFALGDLYFKSSLFEYAMATFEKDKSGSLKNTFGIATCARFLGYYKKAINNYKKLLAMKPNFSEAVLGLAISYQQSADFENSVIYFKKYLEFQKKEEIYIAIANIYLKTEKKEEAKQIIEEGLTYFSGSQELRDLSSIAYK